MIPTLNCLASNIIAALLSPWLPQSRRQTLPHILGKNKVFFTASTSVKLHSNSVRPLCFLYCSNVVTYRSYHLRIIFVTWQKTNFEYPQKGIIPYFAAEQLRHKEKFSEMIQVLDFHWNDGTQAPDRCPTSKRWLWLPSVWSQAPHTLRYHSPACHALHKPPPVLCKVPNPMAWGKPLTWISPSSSPLWIPALSTGGQGLLSRCKLCPSFHAMSAL